VVFDNHVNVTQNSHMPNVLDDEIIGQSERLNDYISIDDVKQAIVKAKLGNACGIDMIPVDILKSDNCVSFLHILYKVCFNSGCVPSEWSKVIISPIPKSTTADLRDPLSYRGIALPCSLYKLYCSILENRLSFWSEGKQ